MKYKALIVVFVLAELSVLAFSLLTGGAAKPVEYDLARARVLLDGNNPLRALDIAERAVSSHPEHAGARTLGGIVRLRMRLYQQAIREFEQAVATDPELAVPWIGLAHSQLALGKLGEAVSAARQATVLDPRSTEAWLVLGQAHWLDRSYAEAESAALEARRLDPRSPDALDLLLAVYFDREDPDKFEALIDEAPDGNAAIRNRVLLFLVRQGEFARAWEYQSRSMRRQREIAILEAELALARSPERTDLYPSLIRDLVAAADYERALEYARVYSGPEAIDLEVGKAYWMTGALDNAVRSFEAASRHGVDKLSAEVALAAITGRTEHWREAFRAEQAGKDYWILARLDALSRSAPARVRPFLWRYAGIYDSRYYSRAVEEALALDDPDAPDLDLLLTIGTAYERMGRPEEAERYLERAREAFPSSPEPAAKLGALVAGGGDAARAVALMEEAIELDPGHTAALFNLAWVYDQLGQDERAAGLYRRAIDRSALGFDAMNNLALIYSEQGRDEEARRLLERAIETHPGSEAAYYNLASYYSARNDWRAARAQYDRVLDINPLNSAALLEQGRISLYLGRLEEAVERLNAAVALDPQMFEAYILVSSAYEKLGRSEVALAAAREAERIRSGDPELVSILSRLQEGIE